MRWAALGLAIVLVAPLLVVDVPPLLDYPNHLARLFLLAHGAEDPVLARMFVTQWGIIPNLAIDVVGPALMSFLPVHVAGRVLLGFVLLLPFVGVLAFHRAVFRRWDAWPLASALVAGNAAFLLGFLNYVIGIGAGLLVAALWIAGRERWPVGTVVAVAVGMVGVFFCHLMGVVFALVLVGCWELAAAWRDRRLFVRGAAVLAVAIGPLGLYRASVLGDHVRGAEYLDMAGKLAQVEWPFIAYVPWLDSLTAAAVMGVLIWRAMRGRLHAPAGIVLALWVLVGLYVVAPYAFKGTQSLDTRFTLMVVLLLFAGVVPVGRSGWVMAGLAGLFVVRMGVVAVAWAGHAGALAEFRRVIAPVPAGAHVLVASVSRAEAPGYWAGVPMARRLANTIPMDTHLPALLLIERRAFWPVLFNEPAQQPVAWVPELQALADQVGGMIDHDALKPAMLCGYAFVLVLDAGGDPAIGQYRAEDLELMRLAENAALFRIRAEPRVCL